MDGGDALGQPEEVVSLALAFRVADATDAGTIASIRNAAADALTARHGIGHWSSQCSERGVIRAMQHGQVLLAGDGATPVGTLCLSRKKPWAIDRDIFRPARAPRYLVDMAVHPDRQRSGIGRACLDEAARLARADGADAIWLDAYDAPAGAGEFYRRAGFVEVGRRPYRGVPLVYFELRFPPRSEDP